MPRVPTNHFPAAKQQWMIVGGKASEACLDRQPANGRGNEIDFGSVGELVAGPACSQAPDKAHETGEKKYETNSNARRERPMNQHSVPKNRQSNKVGPDQ